MHLLPVQPLTEDGRVEPHLQPPVPLTGRPSPGEVSQTPPPPPVPVIKNKSTNRSVLAESKPKISLKLIIIEKWKN